MNTKNIYLIIFFLFLFTNACRKEKKNNENESTIHCSTNTFQVILNENINPISVIEDNNSNTIILGDSGNIIKVIKINSSGQITWKKEFPEFIGKPENIISLENNTIIISTAYSNKQDSGIVSITNGAWIPNGNWINQTNGCNISYQWDNYMNPYSFIGKSYLHKLDSNGIKLWTKEYNGGFIQGKTLEKIDNDNLLFIGYLNYGFSGHLEYDLNGVPQDTIKISQDKNVLFLYKLNNNGDVIWQKVFSDIFDLFYNMEEKATIVKTDNDIAISTYRDLIILNLSGEEVRRFSPVSPYCNNVIYSIEKADNNNIYVSGIYNYRDGSDQVNYTKYFSKISNTGNVIWTKNYLGFLTFISNTNIIIHSDEIGYVYSNSGNQILSSDFLKTYCVCKNCNDGFTSVYRNLSGKINVSRSTL